MKIFTSEQIREIDAYTIENEPIASADLMERAAAALCSAITALFPEPRRVIIFAGPGNNGGDGLALARMLCSAGYMVEVVIVMPEARRSPDFIVNLERLKPLLNSIMSAGDDHTLPSSGQNDIIIDAIVGSGLTRPLEGYTAKLVNYINACRATVIAVDIPSGLFSEHNDKSAGKVVVRADYTFSFQFPKLAFMFPENRQYTGEWSVLPIGLSEEKISKTETPFYYLESSTVGCFLKKRTKFDHKGIFGHALLIAGSYGKTGAAVLAAKASLRAGAGLLTCHIPGCGYNIMQISIPEAMVMTDKKEEHFSHIADVTRYNAVGIGPGLGTHRETAEGLLELFKHCDKPVVIDADALNLISQDRSLLEHMPVMAVLTPHRGEFERLAGKTHGSYDTLMSQLRFSKEHQVVIVLKGAHTSITLPDGTVWFNSTGNSGMATAGSGDVLTGIILSLLGQGYAPEEAALTGVYLHGLAGDIAVEKSSPEALIASDIIGELGSAFTSIRKLKK